MSYKIAAFYQFTRLEDLPALRLHLLAQLRSLDLCGTILLAPEGLNATIAGSEEKLSGAIDILVAQMGLQREDIKFSYAEEVPFKRFKIRLKKEIITFRHEKADPTVRVGVPVGPDAWNVLTSEPGVTVLDTRNAYETVIGTFAGAVDPKIEQFTEFADYVRKNLDPSKHKKIAMYCTGGIRCEKASAFMLGEGFREVYHLKGGILKYLEDIRPADSKWSGECYVFDRRVAVGHGLTTGRFTMCFYCGYSLQESDRQHPLYEEGVSCKECHDMTSSDVKARCRTRHRQILAAAEKV